MVDNAKKPLGIRNNPHFLGDSRPKPPAAVARGPAKPNVPSPGDMPLVKFAKAPTISNQSNPHLPTHMRNRVLNNPPPYHSPIKEIHDIRRHADPRRTSNSLVNFYRNLGRKSYRT